MCPHISPPLPHPTPEANSGPCNPGSPTPSSLEILFSASQSLRPPWFSRSVFKTDSFQVPLHKPCSSEPSWEHNCKAPLRLRV